ncbi:MAG: hypothetical protein LBT23_08970 [Synergistaceae bacterium]|nr:hypothetical protein [Synergistaceae bacterium]
MKATATTTGVNIRKISPDEFYEIYGDVNRRALYYIRNIGKDGFVLSSFDEYDPMGYLICRADRSANRLLAQIVNVLDKYRLCGTCSRLLSEAETICGEIRLEAVKICVAGNDPGCGFISDFLIRKEYAITDKVRIFRCGEQDYRGWDEYMARTGGRLIRWLEEDGFSAVTFENAKDAVMTELRESASNEFGNNLEISPFLDGEGCNILRSVSSVALKEEHPVAYCLVTGPDVVSAVFEQISVAKAYKNTGVLLLTIAESMRRFKEFGYRRAAYAIYDSNTSALAFARKILYRMTSVEKIQLNFEKKIGRI